MSVTLRPLIFAWDASSAVVIPFLLAFFSVGLIKHHSAAPLILEFKGISNFQYL
jgi:hypothetical protein